MKFEIAMDIEIAFSLCKVIQLFVSDTHSSLHLTLCCFRSQFTHCTRFRVSALVCTVRAFRV